MRKVKVAPGVFWVEVPEARLIILCGSPADVVKHLMRRGLIINQEIGGVQYETGPNALLLSDVAVQKQKLSNLGEFPVLQMLYRQGMILPGHPNNTGRKPLIIGCAEQVKAQAEYIYRGNYGLVERDELSQSGLTPAQLRELYRLKRRFAFDTIRRSEDLLDLRVVESDPVELRDGVTIRREKPNVYEIIAGAQRLTVDLNLGPGENYGAPYALGYHHLKREYFAVVHTGEGDGWDPDHPCMASLIVFQGKVYLLDAGPNIGESLSALGLSANEVAGIFQSHCHDDHFAGIPSLMLADHKIPYFASKVVRMSVAKKLSALLSVGEDFFERCFEIHDLPIGEWTNVGGLEVRPVLSPHPVETNIFFFRTLWDTGYKTYAHLSDIASAEVLQKMITEDPKASGISKEGYERIRVEYTTSVDVKKVDVGGGLIHGRAEDFAGDATRRILLSHRGDPFTDREKEIGGNASFGMVDVLIPAAQDFMKQEVMADLQTYLPTVPPNELLMLLNCPMETFNPGARIIRGGQEHEFLYFVVSGLLEYIDTGAGVRTTLGAGAIAGEVSGILGVTSHGTYRTISVVQTIRISCAFYREFLARNDLYDEMKRSASMRRFLQSTWLFGDMISSPVKNRIIRDMRVQEWPAGTDVAGGSRREIVLVRSGEIEIIAADHVITTAGPGDIFGSEIAVFGEIRRLSARTTKASVLCHLPATAFMDIPAVRWKLLETYQRRVRAAENQGVNVQPRTRGTATAGRPATRRSATSRTSRHRTASL